MIVEEILQGLPENVREVEVDSSRRTSCYFRLEKDERYVIYGASDPKNLLLIHTGVCSGSFTVRGHELLVQALLAQKTDEPSRIVGFVRERTTLYGSTRQIGKAIKIVAERDGQRLEALALPDGQFEFRNVAPGTWHLRPESGEVIHDSDHDSPRNDGAQNTSAPRMRAAFGKDGPAWTTDNIHRVYTRVVPGFIRVDADEVTYPLHIMLRYRLERAMLGGDLELADLPGAWNEGMRELLGIVPTDDAVGCLQDIHWPDGGWGYFPTYTLGALAAAQLFAAAQKAHPGLMAAIGKGDFAPLLGWLRFNVHGKGSIAGTDEILGEATGAPLGAAAFKAHLESRYLSA